MWFACSFNNKSNSSVGCTLWWRQFRFYPYRFTHCRCWEGFQTGPPGPPGEAALGNLCPASPRTASWQSRRPRPPAVKHEKLRHRRTHVAPQKCMQVNEGAHVSASFITRTSGWDSCSCRVSAVFMHRMFGRECHRHSILFSWGFAHVSNSSVSLVHPQDIQQLQSVCILFI